MELREGAADSAAVPAATQAALPPPDWATLAEDIHCPMCKYNLRGLSEPRCPECGFRFIWQDLLEAKTRPHPYLYEHHPRSPIRSFWRTALTAAVQPGRFWGALHPAQPSRPGRLLRYWIRCAMVMALPFFALWVVRVLTLAAVDRTGVGIALLRRLATVKPAPWTVAFLEEHGWTGTAMQFSVNLFFAVLAWPWLTYCTLLIFAQTMRRVRVQPIHAVRCVVYCQTSMMWGSTILSSAVIYKVFADERAANRDVYVLMGVALLAWAWTLYALAMAYRRYMQFDRPIATVLASQMIVALVCLNILAIPIYWS
jgi:hypothetical protein